MLDDLSGQLVAIAALHLPRPAVTVAWQAGQMIADAETQLEISLSFRHYRYLADRLAAAKCTISPAKLKKLLIFYRAFPAPEAVRPELSWTHYALLIALPEPGIRTYYVVQAAANHWSTRELQRQIKTQSHRRTQTAANAIAELIKEQYILEFVRAPHRDQWQERDLEQALLDHLQSFMLELGTGFAFVARQKRIVTESGKQFYIDLVFYHVLHQCYVLLELKVGELTHRDIGQMDLYVRLYDHHYRRPSDQPTIGIILCTEKDDTWIKYSLLHDHPQLYASTFIIDW
jgi:predicted nuclease of restriction endonuclease-like (RecB) superfamily